VLSILADSGARGTLEDVYSRYQETLGEDHPATWLTAKSLAVTLRRLGEVQKAAAIITDASARHLKPLRADHPDTIACQLEHACVYWALDHREPALALADGAYRAYGKPHPFTLAGNTLAVFCRYVPDTKIAQDHRGLGEEPARQLPALPGPAHQYTLIGQLNRANLWFAERLGADAHGVDDDTYARPKGKFGLDHPTALGALINRAPSGPAVRPGPRWEPQLADATRQCEDMWGPAHPYVVAARQRTRVDVDIELPPT
jgi:hypothetical protein